MPTTYLFYKTMECLTDLHVILVQEPFSSSLNHSNFTICASKWALDSIPLCMCTCFSIHPPVDEHFGRFQVLTTLNRTQARVRETCAQNLRRHSLQGLCKCSTYLTPMLAWLQIQLLWTFMLRLGMHICFHFSCINMKEWNGSYIVVVCLTFFRSY